MERPLLLPLAAMIGGLCISWFFPTSISPAHTVAAFILAILAAFCRNRVPFSAAAGLLFCLWGLLALNPYLSPDLPHHHVAHLASAESVVLEGVIENRPEATESGARLIVEVDKWASPHGENAATGYLLLFVGEGRGALMTGDRIRFSARIKRPRLLGLPGEYDNVRHLALKKIYATGFVASVDDILLIRRGVAHQVQRRIDMLAARIGTFIDGATSPAEGSILKALVIGDAGQIDRRVKDAYSRTGVNHILSISGFHVGIIAVFIYHLLMTFAKRSEYVLLNLHTRRIILFLTLPLLVFYLFLSGAAPATLRSVIMIGAGMIAMAMARETDAVNTLILAAVAILAFSPSALFDLSFQLSFVALWGIIVLTPLFMLPFERFKERRIGAPIMLIMASAAAILATLLPVAYHFHRASVTGLISNLIIVPLMGYGAVIAGFCAVPLVFVAPPAAALLFSLAAFLIKISNAAIAYLANLPTLPLFTPSLSQLAISFLFLAALTFVGNARWRMAGCGCLAVVFFATGSGHGRGGGDGKLHLFFFSVGQGESSLIVFPNGKTMLVDGGGYARDGGSDIGERHLAPALWTLGISSLDYMVLTHPHPDHIQGLKYVAANFRVGEFWESGVTDMCKDYVALKTTLADRHVLIRQVNASTRPIAVGNAVIKPLSPEPDCNDNDLNEASLVFMLQLGHFSVLFTGDIGVMTENVLVSNGSPLKCTILKVPHHGSRFSSSPSFITASAPNYAVISAGYNNSFHLPALTTLETLHRYGISTYRTDMDGTIDASCDGNGENIVIHRFNDPFSLTKF